MNLIDAIKSGKQFKRKNWLSEAYRTAPLTGYFNLGLMVADVIADDWEIQEPAVTITRSQFWTAVNESSTRLNEIVLTWSGIEQLARKLGLE